MVKIVIIGGSGHIGSYLIPLLVARHYNVINISRGSSKPYLPHPAWNKVHQIKLDRKALDEKNEFGSKIAELNPDVVVDLITFDLPSAEKLINALKGKVQHYLFCSTIWVYGPPTTCPILETDPRYPIEEYGINKKAIEDYLMRLARIDGFPATSFRPGHIVGKGWIPCNPQGNFDPDVFSTIARGGEITLPNAGGEMLHHVHAEDIAHWILIAMDNRNTTIGECFNMVSPQSLTLRGYAEAMYRYFNQSPRIRYIPLPEFEKGIEKEEHRKTSMAHIGHSACWSMEKSKRLLGFEPRYSSLEAVQESVRELIAHGRVELPAD
jgi:nucleoside-diphosphate-sugar epimerase